jgi:uncharacterized protein YhaN
MHFRSCTLKAFGHFDEVEFDKLSDRVVVLLGPNEAGKSTFFEFLQTMLYGVYPTNPDKHRYTPRDGRALEGSAEIILSDGTEIGVSRRLARVPQGHLTNGSDLDLRNKALPAADFISGQVFDAIYALDLHDMTGLEGRAWADVQDRLLGGMNLDFLRSARNVIEEIEREANELWRPDRRGRPVERRLRDEREEISGRLGAAQQREAELLELSREISSGERRLEELGIELPRMLAEARRLDRVGPVATRWQKIEVFREESGNIQSYRHVPENPAAIVVEWHRRDDEYASQLATIEQQLEQGELDQLAVGDSDQTIVRYTDEIHGWSKRAGAHETNLAALRKVGIALCDLRLEVGEASANLAEQGKTSALAVAIKSWEQRSLTEAVERLEDSSIRIQTLETRNDELASAIDRRKPFAPVIAIAASAMAAVVGVLQVIPLVWMASGLVGLIGIVWLAFELAKTSSLRSEKDRLQIHDAVAERQALFVNVEEGLNLLSINPGRRARPDKSLVSDLVGLKALLDRRRQLVTQARALTGMLDADRNAIAQLTIACETMPDYDVTSTVSRLQSELGTAIERVRRADSAKQRHFRLNHDRERILADRQALVDQIVQVEAALVDLGEGEIEAGVTTLERRRRAALRADHEENMLDKDHPGWRDFEDELALLTDADMSAFSDTARLAREDELDRLRQDKDFETIKVGKKRNELNILLKNETPDEVESQIATIDDQLQQTRRKRDRLALLANIIRRADQQFRFKHQPDVIRKASEYLDKITAGRYQKLILEDEGNSLMVFQRGSGLPIEVDESLSQGTRDQVYLSIRFALMDHLDAHQERLPAFLDEVFVNWDKERRLLGYEILKDLSKRRQVFVFTCHPWMADELETVVTAKRITI